MSIRVKVLSVIAVILIAVCFVSEIQAWPWSKNKKEYKFQQEFSSGWKIVGMLPALDTDRVDGFKRLVSRCPPCIEEGYKAGNFVLFRELFWVDFENWWTVIVDISHDHFLNIPLETKVVMRGIDAQGDTIEVESERIVFCKGWSFSWDGKRMTQHTVLDNSLKTIQVKPYRDIGRDDFEHGEVNGEKYIIGYIFFGKDVELDENEVVDFLFPGINAYPVTNRLSRR